MLTPALLKPASLLRVPKGRSNPHPPLPRPHYLTLPPPRVLLRTGTYPDPERFDGDWKKRYPPYAFFPFGDAVQIAIEAGVTAIIQPGGSVKDEESIKICNQFGIPMLFTGVRHFKH